MARPYPGSGYQGGSRSTGPRIGFGSTPPGRRVRPSVGARFAALLVDSLVLLVLPLLAIGIQDRGPHRTTQCGAYCFRVEATPATNAAVIVVLLLSVLAVGLYGAWEGRTGAALGKRIAGLRVLDRDTGEPPGPGRGATRMLVRTFVSLPCAGLGVLWALWDVDAEGWHDKLAGTGVAPTDR